MPGFSNWREEFNLSEVVTGKMTDTEALKKVSEKKGISNKVTINPKLDEAVKEIGGEVISMVEADTTAQKQRIDMKQMILDRQKLKIRRKDFAQKKREGEDVDSTNASKQSDIIAQEETIKQVNEKKRKNALQIQKIVGEGYETKKTSEVLAAFKRDPKVRKRFEKAAKKEDGPGSVKNRAADSMLQTAKDTAKRKGDTSKSDDRYAYEEVVHNEGVMKFIKDRVGGKKKPEKKASMDSTTDKLHTWRKSTSDKQKEHEKYVNFLPVDEAVKGQDTEMRKVKADERKAGTDPKNTEDPTGKNYAKGQRASVSWWKDKTKVQKEEVVTELNRYGKETGKATGSLNKRPGSPVATRNQPNSAVNIVRRNIIRPQTGRPEGQRKKVKGEKGRVQPGDRKFTPAQTISRMRAQVAAADAAMRDTRGT